jgi:hypothetical protein
MGRLPRAPFTKSVNDAAPRRETQPGNYVEA